MHKSSLARMSGHERTREGGRRPGAKDGITEHMLVLAGDATVTGDDATSVESRAGVSLVMPDGWTGRWEVRQTPVRPYTIRRTAPADASA